MSTTRPVWTGTITLGEVAVPVALHVAQQRDEIGFRTLHRACATPIKQKRYCPHDDAEIGSGDTVKGYEFSPNQFVLADPGLEPQPTRTIDLAHFVPAADVPQLHLDRSYLLTPAEDDASRYAYAVLRAALEQTDSAGVTTLVMYGKQNTAVVHAIAGSLYLTTLFLAADVRPPAKLRRVTVADREVKLAARLIRARRRKFVLADLGDNGRGRLQKKLDAKIAAGDTVAAAGAQVATVDLAEVLHASVKTKPRARATAKRA